MPPAEDTPLAALRFLVVDVETTGMAAAGDDRVTEVAAIALEGGRVTPVLETLVHPRRPIPPRIAALTGITDAMVAGAPPFAAIADRFADALDGRVFAAHNASFDWGFCSAELARAGRPVATPPSLCTVRLARRVLPGLPRRSLDHVTAHYGVRIAHRHRAGGDALATAHVLRHLLADAAAHGVATWGALASLLARATARARRTRLPRPMDVDPFDWTP